MNYISESPSPAKGTPVVLVTGGAGFIGSHVVDALLSKGCRVIVVDNLSTGKLANLAHHTGNDNLVFIQSDICDGLFPATHKLSSNWQNIDVVIHLAAQTSVVKSLSAPLADARANYIGTLQVMEYVRITGVRRMIFISSSAIYGEVIAVPISEGHQVSPLSPYGVHKFCGEVLMRYLHQTQGSSTIAFRLFNVYGPRQDPASPYSGVISIFADRALTGASLVIYGDGSQSRDFVFVSDVANAITEAAVGDDVPSGVYNIGSGKETTINGLAQMIMDVAASRSSVTYVDARPGDPHRSLADISQAAAMLNFRPRVALQDGLTETISWFRGGREMTPRNSLASGSNLTFGSRV